MKSFVLHDETVNTHGYRMLTSGCDLTEFKKNPVMLLNHDDWALPIGRWENIRTEEGKILADPVFDDQDATAREVKSKVERDFIRMASVGAWPPDEVINEVDPMKPGNSLRTVNKWVMREASIVTIGSNHNALAFYDRNTGKIMDDDQVINLFDKSLNNGQNMNELKGLLKLADNVTDKEIETAVTTLIADKERLQGENTILLADKERLTGENTALAGRVDEFTIAARDAKAAEAIALVDAAVKDGRINNTGRDAYLKLFDSNFENAKAVLDAIPVRQGVAERIQDGNTADAIELADLTKKSWDEIDKAGKLTLLKTKFPDVYNEKFEQRYGTKPKT